MHILITFRDNIKILTRFPAGMSSYNPLLIIVSIQCFSIFFHFVHKITPYLFDRSLIELGAHGWCIRLHTFFMSLRLILATVFLPEELTYCFRERSMGHVTTLSCVPTIRIYHFILDTYKSPTKLWKCLCYTHSSWQILIQLSSASLLMCHCAISHAPSISAWQLMWHLLILQIASNHKTIVKLTFLANKQILWFHLRHSKRSIIRILIVL